MARILVQFAHPALERSRVHRRLLDRVPHVTGITLNDLYEAYPDFEVDVAREQRLLVEHDLIVFQHPFFWYSTPPLLKQWEDLVLEHGWAYGKAGRMLHGKRVLHAISAGGREEAYQHDGLNRHTVRELLAPLEQTARLCGMRWAPPFMVHGTHRMSDEDIEEAASGYGRLLLDLHEDRVDLDAAASFPTLNAALQAARGGHR